MEDASHAGHWRRDAARPGTGSGRMTNDSSSELYTATKQAPTRLHRTRVDCMDCMRDPSSVMSTCRCRVRPACLRPVNYLYYLAFIALALSPSSLATPVPHTTLACTQCCGALCCHCCWLRNAVSVFIWRTTTNALSCVLTPSSCFSSSICFHKWLVGDQIAKQKIIDNVVRWLG